MKKYLIITCLALGVICAWLAHSLYESCIEKDRLQHNQEAMIGEIQLYETKAGESAASVLRLQLTYNELDKHYQDVCQEAKDLGIKLKRLQSVSQTSTAGNIQIQTEIKDSIRYVPEIHLVDTLKTFSWRDHPWADISGVIDSGKVNLSVQTTDTIIQIVHRVPKRFLFFKFGCKAIRQEIISKSPYNKIVYSEYIELTK